ncbi:MAG: GbsR/MarR family transcriptional regulator [Rubrimonas sp.]
MQHQLEDAPMRRRQKRSSRTRRLDDAAFVVTDSAAPRLALENAMTPEPSAVQRRGCGQAGRLVGPGATRFVQVALPCETMVAGFQTDALARPAACRGRGLDGSGCLPKLGQTRRRNKEHQRQHRAGRQLRRNVAHGRQSPDPLADVVHPAISEITEISVWANAMNLTPLQSEFVLHFGEMGSRWGINRTVGQIYAVLFLSPEPLNAEDIVERLGVSRSNVSMGLKELQAWRLVRLRHIHGDRRDYFTTPNDLWEIVRTLVEERKKREIDPTLTKLRELEMARAAGDQDAHAYAQITALREMIELLTGWYDEMSRLETERLKQLLAMGARITKIVGLAGKVVPLGRGKSDHAEDERA